MAEVASVRIPHRCGHTRADGTCPIHDRPADGQPVGEGTVADMVLVRRSDVEDLVCLLEQYGEAPHVWGKTLKRLEAATGRSAREIVQARARATRTEQDTLERDARLRKACYEYLNVGMNAQALMEAFEAEGVTREPRGDR